MAKYTTTPSPAEERMLRYLEKWGNLGAYIQRAGEEDPKKGSLALYQNAIRSPVDAALTYAEAAGRLNEINKLLAEVEGEHSDAKKVIKPYLERVKKRLEATQKRAKQYINVDGVRAELQEHVAKLHLIDS